MRRKLVLGSVAAQELSEAIDWYNGQQKGLGKRLRTKVTEAFARIRSAPEARVVVRPPDIRKARVEVFPYIVYYRILPDRIRVVSIFHTSRDPSSWERTADEDVASGE